MTKKILLAFVLLLVCGASAFAQGKDSKREKMMKEIQEFKLKYIAQEIDLKDDQKERFFELYNEMSEKRAAVMQSAWKLEHKLRKTKDATDEQYREASEAMTKARAEDSNLEKQYDAKFSEFLSSKQVFKMKAAENEFRKKMEQMRNRKHKSPKFE